MKQKENFTVLTEKTTCMKRLSFCLLLFITTLAYAHEYHVSKKGNDSNDGSSSKPFLTIQRAVKDAFAGDTITVHEGIYREWVNPIRGGESDSKRIVYRAAPDEKVEIKGSEHIIGWKKQKNGVWKVNIKNSFFKDYNPYKDSIHGDWFNDHGRIHHTGEVFLNGKSLYEKETLDKVLNPVADKDIVDKEGSTFTWYCESDENNTTIWANFHGSNPNKQLVEISARRTCFYPSKPGINYITIKGFHINQAATQWAAPTAEQIGMIATHWNKGWIIEDNIISDSKCSGITLGKERGTGHNVWSNDKTDYNRGGAVYYNEVVFNVLRNNWDKEHIGSHIVRNNQIYNCGQTGICGSMGAVFSTIENNHIYNIWTKRQFSGAELAGIKFHAPVDASIKNNRIHDAGRGIWLDWMTQGTRVSNNLLYRNDLHDLFLEVNHGPFIVDNNIFLSSTAITDWSEGGAFVHNLIAGSIEVRPIPDRFTPYFLPHSIEMAGLNTIAGGDDRYYNNIFIGNKDNLHSTPVLSVYDSVKYPVQIEGNLYSSGAKPSQKDVDYTDSLGYDSKIELLEKGKEVYLKFAPHPSFFNHNASMINTELLGETIISRGTFNSPDGKSIKFDVDYFGEKRPDKKILAGPFADLNTDQVELKVW